MKKSLSILTGFLLILGTILVSAQICPGIGGTCTNNDISSYLGIDQVTGCESGQCTPGPDGTILGPHGQPISGSNFPSTAFSQAQVMPGATGYNGPAGSLSLPPGGFPQGGAGGGDPGSYLLSVFPAISGFLQNFAVLAPEDETGEGGPATSSGPFLSGNPAQDAEVGSGSRELEVLANGNIGKLRGQTVSLDGTANQRLDTTNNREGVASVRFNDGLADTTQLNAATTYYQDDQAIVSVQTPKDTETNIVVNPGAANGVLNVFTLPLADKLINYLSKTLVSAQQGTGQHMHLNGDDMDKSGNNIRTTPHIDLDNYRAGGQELVLEIGIRTRVHNQRIDAAPLLEELDINVNKLSNKLATKDSFIVTKDPNSKGVIRSEDGTFFHTDRTSNPGASAGEYARLIINTERLEMFS